MKIKKNLFQGLLVGVGLLAVTSCEVSINLDGKSDVSKLLSSSLPASQPLRELLQVWKDTIREASLIGANWDAGLKCNANESSKWVDFVFHLKTNRDIISENGGIANLLEGNGATLSPGPWPGFFREGEKIYLGADASFSTKKLVLVGKITNDGGRVKGYEILFSFCSNLSFFAFIGEDDEGEEIFSRRIEESVGENTVLTYRRVAGEVERADVVHLQDDENCPLGKVTMYLQGLRFQPHLSQTPEILSVSRVIYHPSSCPDHLWP